MTIQAEPETLELMLRSLVRSDPDLAHCGVSGSEVEPLNQEEIDL
jgi:hypothetical protein